MNKFFTTRRITEAAIIGALYVALGTLPVLNLMASGAIQLRVAEALTILPFFTPAAIPGLFIGCIVTNIFGTGNPIDIIFGSLATLVAAILTWKTPKKVLAPLPPIIVNGIVVGIVLHYMLELPIWYTIATVAIGEAIACYAIGYPLLLQLEKMKHLLFKK